MTQNFGSTLPTGWGGQLSDEENERNWAIFRDRFGFTSGIDARSWPAIAEPIPSVVFDLGAAPAATPGGAWAARVDAINAEALRCFVTDWNDDPNFVVLDWQHPATPSTRRHTLLRRSLRSSVSRSIRTVTTTYSVGTTSRKGPSAIRGNARCVFGERMVEGLGRTLSTWLPRLRVNGEQVDSQVGWRGGPVRNR